MKKATIQAVSVIMCLLLASCGGSEDKTGASPGVDISTPKPEATFQEITALDTDEVKVVVTSVKEEKNGITLTAEIENKSADITYMFSTASAAINGVEYDPFWAQSVAPGKKSKESIDFTSRDLAGYGVDFSDIEVVFKAYDNDDWTAYQITSEPIHIYPYGEEAATSFSRAPADGDITIADNEFVTATIIGTDPDSIWGYSLELYLVNKTDSEAMFSVDDSSVNGYMLDPFWATSVSAGKVGFSSISWSSSGLDELGIEGIENIEFKFKASNYDNWQADPYFEEVVSISLAAE